MNIDLASVTQAQAVVLVEGMSDKAALEALAERRGQMLGSGASAWWRWAVRPTPAASSIYWARTGSAPG
jgi:hypothetical protein